MATGLVTWSKTAATNANADSAVNFAEGQAPSSVNDSARGLMASVAKWRDDLNGTLTTAGSSTVYTVSSNQTFASLAAGLEVTICLDETNGATVTLNVDGLGAKPLRPAPGVELAAAALKVGVPYRATYFTSNSGEWILHGISAANPLTDVQITGATALTAPAVDDELPIYDLSATTNKKITLADHLKVINGLTEDTSPDAAADFAVTYDNSASAAKKVKLANLPSSLPRGYLHGCTLSNNGSDATNDIDIAAGVCRDSTNAVDIIVPATTGKQLDANWAAGAAAGMRNSAAGIANGTYHIYAVRTAASSAADFYAYAGVAGTDPDSSASISTMLTALQAETGGASYAYARRIGSIIRVSNAIKAFIQTGDFFEWVTPTQDWDQVNPGTSAVTRTLQVPLGIIVNALMIVGYLNSATTAYVYVSALDQTDSTPSAAFFTTVAPAGGLAGAQATVKTNSSAQVRSRQSASAAGAEQFGGTIGYYDPRGRV
jgi:hypothetical protein